MCVREKNSSIEKLPSLSHYFSDWGSSFLNNVFTSVSQHSANCATLKSPFWMKLCQCVFVCERDFSVISNVLFDEKICEIPPPQEQVLRNVNEEQIEGLGTAKTLGAYE